MRRLGELELSVLNELWNTMGSELTVREVAEHFPDLAYTTVLTVLNRLERKGMVRRIREERTHRYVATATREAYTAALMHDALGTAPDPNAVLLRFAETVTPAEAAVLRAALAASESSKPGQPESPGHSPSPRQR
jgi:predicted transcriptional regulator